MDIHILATQIAAAGRRSQPLTEDLRRAKWVAGDPDAIAPISDFPDAAEQVDAERKGLEEGRVRSELLAMAGIYIRSAIPDAAQTVGKHWMVNFPGRKTRDTEEIRDQEDGRLIRVTVGLAQVMWATPSDSDFEVWLRPAASPIREALDLGQLTTDQLVEHGIREENDGVKKLDDDALYFRCPTLEAAEWFLGQPAVVTAIRLMNAKLVADNSFGPHRRNYRRDVAVSAWAAAEAARELDEDDLDDSKTAPSPATPGFDRPYRGRPVEADYAETMQTSPAARERALDEHDRLCRLLIDYLAKHGITAGELFDQPVDVAWRDRDGDQYVAEVKSCLGADDTVQLRLGLGQILDYRYRLADRSARGVLLVSRVLDPAWHQICSAVDVQLLDAADWSTWQFGSSAQHAHPATAGRVG